MGSFIVTLKRRGKARTAVAWRMAGATVAAMHITMLRLRHWPLEVLVTFAPMPITTLRPKLLRCWPARLFKSGAKTAWTAKSPSRSQAAELLPLLTPAKAMTKTPSHSALRTRTTVHPPPLWASLR